MISGGRLEGAPTLFDFFFLGLVGGDPQRAQETAIIGADPERPAVGRPGRALLRRRHLRECTRPSD